MVKPASRLIKLTQQQRLCLRQITRRQTNPYFLVLRAKIILAADAAINHSQLARQLVVDRSTVLYWLDRWAMLSSPLAQAEAEAASAKLLLPVIEHALRDKPRAGAPATFTPEQICQIIAVACEKPDDSGRPISHWSPRELADEVMKRKIVERISVRSVGRFLKSGGIAAASRRALVEC